MPSEVALGMAAELQVDVRVRGGQGRTLGLSARSSSAPDSELSRPLGSDDEVMRLRLAVTPAIEGVSIIDIRARVGGAVEGVLRRLASGARPARRLLLAGAPSWEARRAGEALDAAPARVDVLTRVGRSAVLSRRVGLEPMPELLGSAGGLSSYD